MIIPIGHEDSGTRRRAWVTIIIIAACMGAWLATVYAHGQMESKPPEAYREEARLFWEANPYLETDRRLAKYMVLHDNPELPSKGTAFTEVDWDLWLLNKRLRANALLRDQGRSPSEGKNIVALQEELNRLVTFGFHLKAHQIPSEEKYPSQRFGLTPTSPTWYGFATHVFMHASWAHILSNLFLFFLVAPALEDRWGRPLFALFYLSAGIFAGAFHMVLSLDSSAPLVGASGAIAGVLGAFLVLFWNVRIKFAYYFFPPIWGTFMLPAWFCLPLWFGNEMVSAWMSQAQLIHTNVAYWAHAGGFLFGALFAMTIRGLRLETRFLESAIDRKVVLERSAGNVAAARTALDQQNYQHAYDLLKYEVEDQPDNPEILLAFWEASVAYYKTDEGSAPILSWLRKNAAGPCAPEAAKTWSKAVEFSPAFNLEASALVLLVEPLRNLNLETKASLALRYVLSAEHQGLPASIILRVLKLAREVDPGIELRALRRLLESRELPRPKHERYEALIVELDNRGVTECDDPLSKAFRETRSVECDDDGAIAVDFSDDDDSFELAHWENVTKTISTRFSETKQVDVIPVALGETHLTIQTGDKQKAKLDYTRIQGLSAGVVDNLSAKPILVIDLLLNWRSMDADVLQTVRIRSDQFDPKHLIPGAVEGMEAATEFIRCLLTRSSADALPSQAGLLSGNFDHYAAIEVYERNVLKVNRT